MEREANYAAVGGFVLMVVAMAIAFIYWYSDARDAKSYERYEIYFEGSVSGLTVGSTVRYLGVDVGRVVALNIDPRSAERVQVIVDIGDDAPVSSKTVAELSLLGVTGLLYVDLLGDAGSKSLVPSVAGERYPVIRSVRSGFDVIISGVPEVMGRVSEVAQRASRLLSDDNLN
ncbi:MAG: MCE family protein, partial [Gammaproteobacteria bacterium]|nr:MCE family protein [Gammaproteobacteria bacterium]